MAWEIHEVREVKVKVKQKQGNTTTLAEEVMHIPAPYDRIVSQLLSEVEHAMNDSGHESLRRQTYAEQVLDNFYDEIINYKGVERAFRSKFLTPLLQRQMLGVAEDYAPVVKASVQAEHETLTIKAATEFYLQHDPTDPSWIESYRRNLIYTPQARWHLGVVMGSTDVKDREAYNLVLKNHDLIMEAMRTNIEQNAGGIGGGEDDDSSSCGIPDLSAAEIRVIREEKLDGFFRKELDRVMARSKI
jgi:hypothetical protein